MISCKDNVVAVLDENPHIETVIFDRDGTLLDYDGNHLIGHADIALRDLRARGIQVVILTNSSLTGTANVDFLNKVKIEQGVHYDHVFSAGDVMKQQLATPDFLHKKFLVLGQIKDYNVFANADQFILTKDDDDFKKKFESQKIDYFFIGAPLDDKGDSFSTVEEFTSLCDFIAQQRKTIYAVFGDFGSKGYILQGDVLDAIRKRPEFVHGEIITFGKPHSKGFLKLFKEKLSYFDPNTTLMVGDDPFTDILFAIKAGMKFVYVSTFDRNNVPRCGYEISSVAGNRYIVPDNPFTINCGRESR